MLSESPEKEDNGNLPHSEGFPKIPSAGKPRQRSKLLFVGLPMLVATVFLFLFLPEIRESLFGKSFDPSIYVTKEVRRGPFQISVIERGTVGSSKNSILTNRVEGTTTIISIVPEGTLVKAPVVSTLEGRVTEISELSQNITSIWVTADPLVVMSPYSFLFFDWPPTEHTVMLGEYTRVLVEVGDSVKTKDYLAGDVVCELDSSVFEDKHREQRITITKSEGELKKSRTKVIEEGVQIYERQKIINLPDYTQMKVDTKIHESKISHVHVGQNVRIRISAFPDRVFHGVLGVVPDVPVRGEWPNSDQMFYEVEIRITGDVAELKTGMNAEVEIISDERDDVLQIPIQALVAVGDQYVSYVLSSRGPEIRRDVKIGASNNNSVEIITGLEAGETVVMNPRSRFDDELSELQSQYDAAQLKKRVQSAAEKQPENKQQKAKQPALSDDAPVKSSSEKTEEK
ncbi:MAG: hypothetical protein IH899_09925 [Planctomycetes bacterium]|nr:hypothetical protein [Planctomycetota bacterium]